MRVAEWRIGHFTRLIPDGYAETLRTGANHIVNPRLAEYRDHLALIVSGPLFDLDRLREIWRFNAGAYDALVDRSFYQDAPPLRRRYSQLAHGPDVPTYFGVNGVNIDLEGKTLPERLEISLDNDDVYELIYLHGETELARQPPPFRRRHRPLVSTSIGSMCPTRPGWAVATASASSRPLF